LHRAALSGTWRRAGRPRRPYAAPPPRESRGRLRRPHEIAKWTVRIVRTVHFETNSGPYSSDGVWTVGVPDRPASRRCAGRCAGKGSCACCRFRGQLGQADGECPRFGHDGVSGGSGGERGDSAPSAAQWGSSVRAGVVARAFQAAPRCLRPAASPIRPNPTRRADPGSGTGMSEPATSPSRKISSAPLLRRLML
jgi:hypothetical protein